MRPTCSPASSVTGPPLRVARIDLDALRHNVDLLRAPRFVADMTGDAYGHGAVAVARAAVEAGAELAVRDDREERELRAAGIAGGISRLLDPDQDSSAALYGLGPTAALLGCRPAMRVSAGVISVKTIDAGEAVSYGYTWRATVRSNLALVPLGYADGVTRAAGNVGQVWLDGALRPIVGRVAMDVIVLNLGTDIVGLGAEAVLYGDPDSATVDDWARPLGISPLEATAGIGARVRRVWT